jgi:hypothetical protein
MSTRWSLADAVASVSALGPFFAVDTHDEDATPVAPWRPLRELVEDRAVLSGRITAVRDYLAAVAGRSVEDLPVRIAASVTQLGLAARLLSPAIAVTVHSGLVPNLRLADLWWQPQLGSMFPLSVCYRAGGTRADLLSGPVHELVAACQPFSVSPRILWGNVASAINGAVTMIGTARPALADRAGALAADLLALPPLRHTSTRRQDGRFQRRSCCLIYQAAPTPDRAAVCGDCVLAADRGRPAG